MLTKKNNKKVKMNKIPKLSSFLHKKEREYFLDQLATLIVTGMDLETALLSIKEEIRDKKTKQVLGYIISEIQHGKALSSTLIKTNIITAHYGALIELGEKTGRLKENIKLVSNQYLKQKTLKSRVVSALIYPAFLLGICFVVALTFAVYVLPQITNPFSRMNVELNTLTKTMIDLGTFFKSYGTIVIPSSIALFALIFLILFIFPKTKHLGQWIILKTPGFKQLIKETEMTNFSSILGELLEAGIPIDQIFDFLKKSTTWNVYNDFYAFAYIKLGQGFSFKKNYCYL
ncbi:MAG TPA: type II secretion system F family protein [Candidatus Dojkabacteria bacterium]|nr:type II secretion system F family protein [Candidatus Dojkabacteria bacterium]HQF36780.1 type II secretion system F family protein [Candidatus Dojkabacteria bacterium]